jgi:hypothetical protein
MEIIMEQPKITEEKPDTTTPSAPSPATEIKPAPATMATPYQGLRNRQPQKIANNVNSMFTPLYTGGAAILPGILIAAIIYAGPTVLAMGGGLAFATGYLGKWLKDECDNYEPKTPRL